MVNLQPGLSSELHMCVYQWLLVDYCSLQVSTSISLFILTISFSTIISCSPVFYSWYWCISLSSFQFKLGSLFSCSTSNPEAKHLAPIQNPSGIWSLLPTPTYLPPCPDPVHLEDEPQTNHLASTLKYYNLRFKLQVANSFTESSKTVALLCSEPNSGFMPHRIKGSQLITAFQACPMQPSSPSRASPASPLPHAHSPPHTQILLLFCAPAIYFLAMLVPAIVLYSPSFKLRCTVTPELNKISPPAPPSPPIPSLFSFSTYPSETILFIFFFV